jgi:PTH1 family peptidyl-tRNA hydrolase
MIKLIVGLGNPGPQYEKTRHNAGFIFLDHLALSGGCSWSANAQFQAEISHYGGSNYKVMLLKPMTFMNKSGFSVGCLSRYYKIKPEEVLVAHDELELAEGVARLKKDGGHAGHNGLRDIIAQIDSRDFFRLRLGIGRPSAGKGVADYVLSRPSQDGGRIIDEMCLKMVGKIDLLISGNVSSINELV